MTRSRPQWLAFFVGAILTAAIGLIAWKAKHDTNSPAAAAAAPDKKPSGASLPVLESESDREARAHLLDPTGTGWESEAFSDRAGAQLERLASWLISDDADTPLPAGLLAPDMALSALRPAELLIANHDRELTVRRLPEQATVPMIAEGEAETTKIFRAFANSLEGSTHRRLKLKIVNVTLSGDSAETRVTADAFAEQGNRLRQQTALWDCRWRRGRDADPPQLLSIRLARFEEVEGAFERWFVDATASALGEDDSFRQQVAYGLHHWLGRIDRAHGLNYFRRNGLALGDANGDGLDDVYLCQPGGLPNRLFLQQADGTLRDASAAYGVDWLDHTASALLIDLDNDADQDLALATASGVQVLENDDNMRYLRRSVLPLVDKDLMSLSAADYDNDGDLDLFVCVDFADKGAHAARGRDLPGFVFHDSRDGGKSVLFRNEGRWTFRDVTEEAGLAAGNWRHSLAAAWEDYDNDGDLDLYVANDYGPNALYRNDRGRFEEVAETAKVLDYAAGMSVSWGDYNRDGWMDLYVGNMFSYAGRRIGSQPEFLQGSEPTARVLNQRFAKGNTLFVNSPSGVFTDMSTEAGVERGRWAWSSLFGDLDNDGWEDLFVANGYITTPDTGDL